jgi:Ca-activated chloride channel family protein
LAGRHRRPRGLRHRIAGRTPLVIATVAVMATGAVAAIQTFADAGGCSRDSGVEVTVAADPGIAPVLRDVAAGWIADSEPEIDGRCVGIDVVGATAAEVAGELAVEAGGSLDIATPGPATGVLRETPTVWVPDSSYWLGQLDTISRNLFTPDRQSLATSPVVLAASPEAAELLGADPIDPAALKRLVEAELPLTVAEPRRDTAGLIGTVWLRTALAPDETDLPAAVALFRGLGEVPSDARTALRTLGDTTAAVPVSEQAVIAHNQSPPPVAATAVPVADAPALDFPYAVVADSPRGVQSAATMFRDALIAAPDEFARHGFRGIDGTTGPGFPIGNGVVAGQAPVLPVGPPEQASQVLRIWISSRSDARVLSVSNVNASMQLPVGGEGTPSRMDVFRATATEGLELFTPDSELGVWTYANDWSELVPVAALTDEHKARVRDAITTLPAGPATASALFETMLAAYQEMKEGYDRSRSNTLILWSDGGDSGTGELTLDGALQELERLVDVTRPIRVILLGLGPAADMAQLNAIADAAGGGAYHLLEPDQIRLIFMRALLT